MMRRLGAGLTVLCFAAAGAWALTPEEILVVANSRSPEGVEIAKQYCMKRHVPGSQIVLLPLSTSASFTRAAYESDLLVPLRQRIEEDPTLRLRIHCLLTVYGVPISVGGCTPTAEEQKIAEGLSQKLEEQRPGLLGQLTRLCELGRSVELTIPSPLATLTLESLSLDKLGNVLGAACNLLSELDKKLDKLAHYRHCDEKKAQCAEIRKRLLGAKGLAEHDASVGDARAGDRNTPVQVQAKIGTEERERWYVQRLESAGLTGLCQQLLADIMTVRKSESDASVDSELSLLYWQDYDLSRWLPNLLNPVFGSKLKPPFPPPTLMVARLDGPTPEVAGALVDRAIEGESKGLAGTLYVDGSALQQAKGGLYAVYDESLEKLAQGVREHTTMEVVLDKGGDLFPPGACPHAALYCGWYSPTKYVDSFTWTPGAVGYHITSFGAQDLRSQSSQHWCKRMLEKGAAATLGPVSEPYLPAFPLPDAFFRLLLSGKLVLVECYYATNPFNSWRMMLIGDPLYNPFRNHPVIVKQDSKKGETNEVSESAAK